MAACKQTATELIQDAFSPCVAVLCSSDVDTICAKNNLTFVELIQPFCRLNTEITIRDPSNVPCSMRNLRIIMRDMNSQAPPLNVGKKAMNDAVSSNVVSATDGVFCSSVSDENYQLKYFASTPWFEAYREVFFQVTSPMEHEFVHHYLSCIFVVSSSNQDPLSQISDLCQQQSQFQLQNAHHSSRWFFSYILKYYLLLHDTSSESLAKAEAIYQSMKSNFGSSVCHLLQINSCCKPEGNGLTPHEEMNGTSNMPDPWSQFFPKYYPQQDSPISNDVKKESELVKSPEETLNSIETGTKKDEIDHPLQNSCDDLTAVNDSCNDSMEKIRPRTSSLNYGCWDKSSNRNKKHGLCLTLSDMDRIRVFVQDFCIQGLIPFVEKQIRILNDQVTNRKSIHRTIFGVTKKLFTGNKAGVQGVIATTNSVVYGPDAPELQVRKLGDIAFMFQLFEVAYQAYHTAKRDFSGDQAWLYFAGASEMAALSIFMQGNSNLHEYPARYMETAITTYLHTCQLPELAMRATFLSTECLKAKGIHRDAALQFMRMPSEADLPCALFLEQAAHCCINSKPPKIRKYAFHMILAGHRFSKAGQKKHGLRCYKQAEQAYTSLNWHFANTHIKSMIGRFSVHLNQLESACEIFKQLLIAQCQQPQGDQSNQLREYMLAVKQYLSQQPPHENCQLPLLPVPFIDCQATKVLLGEDNILNEDGSLFIRSRGFDHGDINNDVWAKMEEMIILSLNKVLPPLHAPKLYCFTQKTNNTSKPVAVANETITFEIIIKNPLKTPLVIENVFLLWTFTADPDITTNKEAVSFSNELEFSKAMMLNSVVQTQTISKISLESLERQKLFLALKPIRTGTLLIRGLSYSLVSNAIMNDNKCDASLKGNKLSLQGKQLIELRGPRLNKTAAERSTKSYAIDNRMNLEITSAMPKLQMKYQSFPHSLFCGEVWKTVVEFTNTGQQELQRIILASPTPSVFSLGRTSETKNSIHIYKEIQRRLMPVTSEWTDCDWKHEIKMPDGAPCCLKPGESLSLPLWLRGPDLPGEHNIELLMYYEISTAHPKLSHRLLQHSFILNTKPSLSLAASAMMSQGLDDSTKNCANSGSLNLSLEIGNNSEELSEMNVMQVSCASPKWHLSSGCPKAFPVILQRESLLLTLKAAGWKVEDAEGSPGIMVFSCVPLGAYEIDSTAIPCCDFTSKSTIFIPEFSQEFEESAVPDSKNMLLLLTVLWKARVQGDVSSQWVQGQHHIKISDFSATTKPTFSQCNQSLHSSDHAGAPSFPMAAQLVRCCMRHPFDVQHNFKRKRLVTVPVEFVAQSTCNFILHITVDNSDCYASQSMTCTHEESQLPTSQLFTWINGSKREILLNPGETMSIPLRASFFSPGTYNLGYLHVGISCANEAAVTYIMQPYLIIISACNTSEQ